MAEAERIIHRSSTVAAIVLAAGEGKRMKSDLPKVLVTVAGRPMLAWVIDALKKARVDGLALVIGGAVERFDDFISQYHGVAVCEQEQRRGTADAVAAAAVCFKDALGPPYASKRRLRGQPFSTEYVLICAGDTPAIEGDVVADFIATCLARGSHFGVLGMETEDPTGYGRLVVGADDKLCKIVEHRDANSSELAIKLCNSGIILARVKELFRCLAEVRPDNAQNEYYLTDVFEIAARQGLTTTVFRTNRWQSFAGINTQEQREIVERFMLQRQKD